MKILDPETFRKNIRKKFNKIIRKKNITLNLEKGIFNYTIQTGRQKNIVRKWDNPKFVMLYVDKVKSLLLNLDKKSNVKNLYLLKRLKKVSSKLMN